VYDKAPGGRSTPRNSECRSLRGWSPGVPVTVRVVIVRGERAGGRQAKVDKSKWTSVSPCRERVALHLFADVRARAPQANGGAAAVHHERLDTLLDVAVHVEN